MMKTRLRQLSDAGKSITATAKVRHQRHIHYSQFQLRQHQTSIIKNGNSSAFTRTRSTYNNQLHIQIHPRRNTMHRLRPLTATSMNTAAAFHTTSICSNSVSSSGRKYQNYKNGAAGNCNSGLSSTLLSAAFLTAATVTAVTATTKLTSDCDADADVNASNVDTNASLASRPLTIGTNANTNANQAHVGDAAIPLTRKPTRRYNTKPKEVDVNGNGNGNGNGKSTSYVENSNHDTGTNSEEHTAKEIKRDESSSSSSSSSPLSARSTQGPRNVMVHRFRSMGGRNLSDKYKVDWKTCLGEGAYGSVHPAKALSSGEKVALKKITKRYTDTSSFCRETDALLRIYNNGGHPNISGLRDMYEDNDHYYLVMDLVSGGEMFDHLIQYGAYSEADAARLMTEVASALAFLHGVGVTHADLKPENLLLCSIKRDDGTIKMIDFGCAHVERDAVYEDDEDKNDGGETRIKKGERGVNGADEASGDQAKSTMGMNKTLKSWIASLNKKNGDYFSDSSSSNEQQSTGTTAYWPPERFKRRRGSNNPQATPSNTPNYATDMWAVGVILFIMLTGVHPFDLTGVATDAEIEEQIKRDPSAPITPGLTSHLSPSAINLITMLMEPNPTDRLTADEMLQHPWIAGDEATTEAIAGSADKLSKFRDLRAIIEAGIFSLLIENGSKDMAMSEYTPKLVYEDHRRGPGGTQKEAPASSVLKKAFEAFDLDGKGFVSAKDLSRVVAETTGKEFSDKDNNDIIDPFKDDTVGTKGLSLSSFGKVAGNLKHKHFPRGHIVFHAGEEGDAMYFINSGKVEIQTKKGKLVHILRHGDFFGEGSLLEDNNNRFSSARCATPVDLIKIKRSDFKRYIENSKSARNTLMHRWKARTLADTKAFIRLQTNLKSMQLKKGDVVYEEGSLGKSMYFVDEERGGELDVKHGDVIVHKYERGESFGESSLLFEKPRSSTVTCVSDECYLHEMMGSDFTTFLESNPKTKNKLLNMCRKRLFKKAVKRYAMEHKCGISNEDLVKAFELADKDKSGELDYEELRSLMHSMDPTIQEEDIMELMRYIAVDEGGNLSFTEFKRLFRSFEFGEKP